MLSSGVSSKMLRSMAEKEGFHHEETLTGFKWMGNRSLELAEKGFVVPYAFEEAIGYMFGDIVPDKDGIAAASVFLRLVTEIYERRQTVTDLFNQLYERYPFGWKLFNLGMDTLHRRIRMYSVRIQA
jgi:phosphoglucomutase